MSTLTFDQTFLSAVAISSVLMVCSAAWIVRVLIQIEKSKVVALSSVLDGDGTDSDLQFSESTSKQLEVESSNGNGNGAIEMSPTRSSRNGETPPTSPQSSPTSKPMTARKARQKQKRISWMFVNTQILSVSVLVLLTYLLLVQSNSAVFLRILGSVCVFGVFLRFQIGEEVRRQRIDRIMLLLSLFLLIASMLSTLVYSMKALKQGEIYEGPARIVGYSQEQYNNTKHDPTTRTDVAVSWGREWGCPWSGGKVCQANVEGAMCESHPDKEQTKHKPNYDTRRNRKRNRNRKRFLKDNDSDEQDEKEEEAEEVEEGLEEDLEDEEKSNQDLEEENKDLATENEELQEEIEELKEENELEDEENDELVDQENTELDEIADEYDEDIMIVEDEEYEDAQGYEDYEFEQDEETLEDEIESATDDEYEEELSEVLEATEEEQEQGDEEYEEDEELLEDYAEEYADAADEEYDELLDEQETTYELDEEKEDAKEEAAETEAEINGGESSTDDLEEEYEEYEEEFYDDDEWYWDESPENYDDDNFEDDYWNYDWDSVWGDYSCEDLFDGDIAGKTYDVDTPAGGDDEWPFVYIYGSCKTCEAYILDYFAEEAFEETQEYKQQAIVYLAGAMAGFSWTILAYIKYRILPTSENEIELLGSSDGGVMA